MCALQVGDEEIFRQQDIEAFHSMLQGNQTVHRYCSRQDVTLLRERQRTLMYKIQDDTSRLEEAQKATKAGTASPRVGESKVLISKMWAELKEAYMVEKKIIQEDGLEYTRQIFPKPTMTGAGTPQKWTTLQKDGPNYLGFWYNAHP